MSKYSNTIEYKIATSLDNTGITKLQGELSKVTQKFQEMSKASNGMDFSKSISQVQELQKALTKNFNSSTDLLDLKSLQKDLNGLSLNGLSETLSQAGSTGQRAFNSFVESAGKVDTSFKSISSFSDKIYNTMGNTVRWGITASIFQTIQNALYRSVDYVKELDTSLNNIQIVTGASASNMREFSKTANKAAADLGASTVAFTDAAQLYAQNGYNQEDYTKLAELTTKVANVTQQSTEDVSEQITSLMAGYKMSIDEATDALSGMAVVAAESASDLGELAEAEQKVASVANTLGVSQDQLTAQLSTIISVTREAPEAVGNSLKTIYARLGDLRLGKTLDDGVSLGDVSSTLEKIGVDVLDVNGNMRDMGSIVEDLMGKWDGLTQAQQQAAAVKLAGKYQYNNLVTLLNNSDMYYQQKETAGNSQGALDEQQAIYMDSMAAKLQKLQTNWEGLVTEIADPDAFKPAIDALSGLISQVTDLIDHLGGITPVLTLISGMMVKTFSSKLGQGLTNTLTNFAKDKKREDNTAARMRLFGATGADDNEIVQKYSSTAGLNTVDNVRWLNGNEQYMSKAQKEQANDLLAQSRKIQDAYIGVNDAIEEVENSRKKTIEEINAQEQQNLEVKERQLAAQKQQLELAAQSKFGTSDLEQLDAVQDAAAQRSRTYASAGNLSSGARGSVEEGLSNASQALNSAISSSTNGKTIDMSSVGASLQQAIDYGWTNTQQAMQDMITEVSGADDKIAASIRMQMESLDVDVTRAVEEMTSGDGDEVSIASIEKFQKALKKVYAAIVDIDEEFDEKAAETTNVANAIEETRTKLAQQKVDSDEALRGISEKADKQRETTNTNANQQQKELQGQLANVEGAAANTKAKISDLMDSTEIQAYLSNIGRLTGSLAQLTIGWQTFSSLGSLWANKDLTDGEKVLQTIIDIGIALPTVINSFKDLTSAINEIKGLGNLFEKIGALFNGADTVKEIGDAAKNIGEVATAAKGVGEAAGAAETIKNVAEAAGGAATAAGAAATSLTGVGTAATGAAGGVGILSGALKGLAALIIANPWGFAAAAIGSIAAAIAGFTFKKQEEEAQDIRDMSDAAAEASSNLITLKGSFDTAYKAYKDGTGSLDAVKQAASDLNGSLDDQNAKLLSTAGSWDAYSAAVNSATAKEQKQNINDLSAGLVQSAKDYSSAPGWREAGFKHNTVGQVGNGTLSSSDNLRDTYNSATSLFTSNGKSFHFADGSSTGQRLDDLDKMLNAFDQDIASTTETLNNARKGTDEYRDAEQHLADLREGREGVQDLKNKYSDQQETYEQGVSNNAAAIVSADSASSGLSMSKTQSLDDYRAQIADYLRSNYADYSKLGEEEMSDLVDAVVEGMANTDTSTAENIAAAHGQQAADDALMGYAQEAKTVTGSDEEADQIYRSLQSSFSNDQIVTLKANFDYAEIKANLNDIIDRLGNGEELDDIIADIKLKNNGDDLKQDIQDQIDAVNSRYDSENFATDDNLKTLGLTTEQVQAYTEALQGANGELSEVKSRIDDENGALQDEITTLKKANNQKDISSEEYDANLKAIKKNEKAIKSNSTYLDRLTNKTIESAQGAKELSESFEDAAKTIRDSNSSTVDTTDAVNELSTGLSHLLNIDMSGWSQEVKNAFVTDNLNDIEAALNGDTDALERLRTAAAQQILVQAGIDPNTDLYTEMCDLISYAQNNIPGIEATAGIDDTGYIDTLNQMITKAYQAGVSIDDIIASLNGSGLDAEIEMIDKPTTVTVPTVNTGSVSHGHGTDLGGGVGNVGTETKTVNMKVPQLKYVTKRDSGNLVAPGVKSSGSGGGKGGSGGGKGGGSGSSYTPKTMDKDDSDLDRYEKVDTHLDSISSKLDKLQDAQDRLSGKKLTQNLSEQVKLLQEQVDWEQQKLEIEKQEAEEYANILRSQYGIQTNSDGFIENYKDTYNRLYQEYANLVDQYNATTDEAGQEALETQVDNAKDRLDKFSDYVDKYDELLSNTIADSEKKIQGYYDKIEDIRIKAFQDAVESVDNLKELYEKSADFNKAFSAVTQHKRNDDPYLEMEASVEKLKSYWNAGTEAMENYYNSMITKQLEAMNSASSAEEKAQHESAMNEYIKNYHALESWKDSPLSDGLLSMALKNLMDMNEQVEQFKNTGTSSIFGEDSADMYDTLETVKTQVEDIISGLSDALDEMLDDILDAIDDISDKIDDQIDKFDNIGDTLDSYKDIISMYDGENAYDKINQVLQAQVSNGMSEIAFLQKGVETLQKLQEGMVEGSEEWEAVQKQITDKQQQILDKTKDTMEQLTSIYENSVNKLLDSWTASTPLGSDLDWMSDEWELINRNADQYLDEVNRAYNIQKLQGKYLDMLDNSNELSTQRKITEQMNQQLKYLREKDNLSQYDVDYANAQLEILQKRIALEDAQRNKSQMKLKRDTQGNYSYVYTANESDVRSAESDLLDSENNAYNLSKDQIKQSQEDSLSALQDAKNMLQNLWTDANLTLEEKTARTQTIIESLKEYLQGCGEQLSTSEKNIINDFIDMAESLTSENSDRIKDALEGLQNGSTAAFDNIDARFKTSITAWLENLESFESKTDEIFDGESGSMIKAFENYQDKLKEVADAAELDFGDMTDSINKAAEATKKLTENTQSFYDKLANLIGKIAEQESALQGMTQQINNANNEMQAFKTQYDKAKDDLAVSEREKADIQAQLNQTKQEYDDYRKRIESANSGGGSGSGGGGGWSPYDDAYAIWMYGAWGGGGYWYGPYARANGTDKADQVLALFNSGYGYRWMDTGGYTGSWGSDEAYPSTKKGKLAILHEKELVLNASDTENIFKAVDAVRELTSSYRNGAFDNAMDAISRYGGEAMKATLNGLANTIDQQVQIDATFPNVKGAEEIERALLSLTNGALQYANRNGQK